MTCRRSSIFHRPSFAQSFLTANFVVDFDSQKDVVNFFGAQMQSTLIAFKGEHETGRSVGDTERSSIAALLNKTL
jgi:thioredoxin 1